MPSTQRSPTATAVPLLWAPSGCSFSLRYLPDLDSWSLHAHRSLALDAFWLLIRLERSPRISPVSRSLVFACTTERPPFGFLCRQLLVATALAAASRNQSFYEPDSCPGAGTLSLLLFWIVDFSVWRGWSQLVLEVDASAWRSDHNQTSWQPGDALRRSPRLMLANVVIILFLLAMISSLYAANTAATKRASRATHRATCKDGGRDATLDRRAVVEPLYSAQHNEAIAMLSSAAGDVTTNTRRAPLTPQTST